MIEVSIRRSISYTNVTIEGGRFSMIDSMRLKLASLLDRRSVGLDAPALAALSSRCMSSTRPSLS